MTKRLLKDITNYKELCDEMLLGYCDILDMIGNDDLHPQIALSQIKNTCEGLIDHCEEMYYKLEEQKASCQQDSAPVPSSEGSDKPYQLPKPFESTTG